MSKEHLESLSFYLQSAEKAIRKWGHPDMLKSDDDISHVAYRMMMADSKFDGRGSLTGFRMSYARYGVLDLFSNYSSKNINTIYSLDYQKRLDDGEGMTLAETLADPKAKYGMEAHLIHNIEEEVKNSPELRFRESDAILKYYLKGMTLREIADGQRITHAGVSLNIKSGIVKLRKKFNDEVVTQVKEQYPET